MPMSQPQALMTAAKRAERTGYDHYVVWDVTYYPAYPSSRCYDVASDEDLEGFYAGLVPLFEVSPDGEVRNGV